MKGNVSASIPLPAEKPTVPFLPGDSVLVKTLNPQKLGKAAFGPPPKVIAVIRTAVLTLDQILNENLTSSARKLKMV